MSKDEFYIGWQDEIPESNKKFLKKVIIGILVLIPVIVYAIVSNQKPFNYHHFEFGTITELSGIYHREPVPILTVESGIPDGFSRNVLLVGFGKIGAAGIIAEIQKSEGNLDGKKISMKGTLIYGDGITLMELTDEEESFIKFISDTVSVLDEPQVYSEKKLTGEILDPKCYFGVMKPGEGKIHKSCTIRCISGGIPPVMRVLQENGVNYDYYLVKGKEGKEINKSVLPYVAQTISVDANIYQQNGWSVAEID
tara:strand:+ start:2159 stop:2917 length:759 start_codon:yes stop_codon:yes gene_type:complete